MRISLRITDAAFRAVVAANAALPALRKINVVGEEDGESVRLNLAAELTDDALQLRIKPVDVNQPGLESEWGTGRPVARGWAQGLFRQYGRSAQEQVIVRIGLHRAPEISALVSINVLGGAHVDSALNVGRARIENRRSDCVVGHSLPVREHV